MRTSNIKSTGFIPVPCPSHPVLIYLSRIIPLQIFASPLVVLNPYVLNALQHIWNFMNKQKNHPKFKISSIRESLAFKNSLKLFKISMLNTKNMKKVVELIYKVFYKRTERKSNSLKLKLSTLYKNILKNFNKNYNFCK